MNRCALGHIFLFCCLGGAFADERTLREPIEWSDVWVVNADKDGLPRVLMVGDSIVRGYYDAAEKALKGKADCARYCTSKFVGHSDFLKELTILLDAYRFDVIHINNGLHGWAYTEAAYAEGLPKLLDTLAEHGKGAAVIWATTTPVRRPEDLARLDEKTERVKERNRIAAEQMRTRGIAVDDLFALVERRAEFYAQDGTHFNEEGRMAQGRQVADIIARHLANTADVSNRPASRATSPKQNE